GASALYHMISPQSQGLFHVVVSVSGSPLDLWALHPPLRRTMVSYADALRCPRSSLEGMTTCFRTLNLDMILNTQGGLLE
ncbi:Carboxylesterase type B, partial [Trinorchestia longiramus]